MWSPSHILHRSYLYAPGSSPRVMAKALASDAEAVVLDLEDAVAPDRKEDARGAVADAIAARAGATPAVHVRINRGSHGYDRDDLRAVVRPGLDAVRLPKVEQPSEVAAVASALDELERTAGMEPGAVVLYVLVESARGVLELADILRASDRIARVALGAADLLADLGIWSNSADEGGASEPGHLATLHARSQLVLVSRACGVGPPIDSVHPDLEDEEGLARAARSARGLGFFGKSVIHPRQLGPVHAAFTPSPEEVVRAERIVEALERAERDGRGVAVVDGQFVDAAVAARAHGVLAIANRR